MVQKTHPGACVGGDCAHTKPALMNGSLTNGSRGTTAWYVTFRHNFHHFDRFELDLHGHIHMQRATFSCFRLKLADIVLI